MQHGPATEDFSAVDEYLATNRYSTERAKLPGDFGRAKSTKSVWLTNIHPTIAPGEPGVEPRWTRSTKEGLGTAYHTSCKLWFTLSHGIVNEIYYPTTDQPNTRDLQLLITDGETFCHEERRDLTHEISYPERNCLLYRLTNTAPEGRYRVIKEICADPHRPVLLMRTRLEVVDQSLRGKLRLYALLAPHLVRGGANNSAWVCNFAGHPLFHAAREDTHLSFGCAPDFTRRSVGFVGVSDGWQDLMSHLRMDWQYSAAENGNIALTAELDSSAERDLRPGMAVRLLWEESRAQKP